jgi:hypothetical protein
VGEDAGVAWLVGFPFGDDGWGLAVGFGVAFDWVEEDPGCDDDVSVMITIVQRCCKGDSP